MKKGSIGIIGLGKFGNYLTNELTKSGKSVICIDKDETKVKKVLDRVTSGFISDDLSPKTLEETGFKDCETIIICISEHLDTAIFATLNALSLGVNKVIALSNSEEQGIVLSKLGAEVVYPFKDSANKLAKKLLNNNFLDYIALSEEVEIIEVRTPKFLIGKTILESEVRKKFKINIIAIENKDEIETNLTPDYVFKKMDTLVLIGKKDDLREFASYS